MGLSCKTCKEPPSLLPFCCLEGRCDGLSSSSYLGPERERLPSGAKQRAKKESRSLVTPWNYVPSHGLWISSTSEESFLFKSLFLGLSYSQSNLILMDTDH